MFSHRAHIYINIIGEAGGSTYSVKNQVFYIHCIIQRFSFKKCSSDFSKESFCIKWNLSELQQTYFEKSIAFL